jgi:very-short-patch-repair endonuclease
LEVIRIKGLKATTLHRTLLDLCVEWAQVEALIAIDMSMRARLTDRQKLWRFADRMKGRPGAARLRELAVLAAPAESPMETRLRWLLIRERLPKPEAQVDLHDGGGQFIGRADLYYPNPRLVIEFDGGNHRERLVSDNRRQNLLIRAGFRILRFTAADIFMHPDVVAAQVRGSL